MIRLLSEICSEDGEHVIGRGPGDKKIFDCFNDAEPFGTKIANEHSIDKTFLRVIAVESGMQNSLGVSLGVVTSFNPEWSFIERKF